MPEVDTEGVTSEQILSHYFEKLTLSMRVLEGTSLEEKEKSIIYYENSKALFDRLKNG